MDYKFTYWERCNCPNVRYIMQSAHALEVQLHRSFILLVTYSQMICIICENWSKNVYFTRICDTDIWSQTGWNNSNLRRNSNPGSGRVEIIVTLGYYFLKYGNWTSKINGNSTLHFCEVNSAFLLNGNWTVHFWQNRNDLE